MIHFLIRSDDGLNGFHWSVPLVYQYEQEAYSAMRSGRKYTPGENSNTQTRPVVDELEKLRRNTEYNANTRIPTSRTTISGPKRRSKMFLAPIESLTEFNVIRVKLST